MSEKNVYRWLLRLGYQVLIQNVQLLPAGELDLVRAAVGLLVLDSACVLAHPGDLALRKRARVVLVQAVLGCLPLIKYAIV